jgi:hypothetical protein
MSVLIVSSCIQCISEQQNSAVCGPKAKSKGDVIMTWRMKLIRLTRVGRGMRKSWARTSFPTALRLQHLLLSNALHYISAAFLPLISVPTTTCPARATSLPVFKSSSLDNVITRRILAKRTDGHSTEHEKFPMYLNFVHFGPSH